jgi:hypothetical protein
MPTQIATATQGFATSLGGSWLIYLSAILFFFAIVDWYRNPHHGWWPVAVAALTSIGLAMIVPIGQALYALGHGAGGLTLT